MDALTVANEITPYVAAAVGAYGTAVLARAGDASTDAAVSLGQRILQRIRNREESRAEIEQAVSDAAGAPQDEDFQTMLRVQIKRALLADPELTADIARLLSQAPTGAVSFTASGQGSVAVQRNSGIISTGSDARIRR